ncbi:MAG: DUF4315 family protein [Lachnospiraceae bacterium]|nr:DUF4315 family protein [Lachnospiraceae bacterium]
MISKLQKLREEDRKASKRAQEAVSKSEAIKEKLKEAEAEEVLDIVDRYKMTPEELAEFLEVMNGSAERKEDQKASKKETDNKKDLVSYTIVDEKTDDKKEDFDYDEI